jgi:hypothetical protein
MASTPIFAATPKVGNASLSLADASRTAPTNVGTVLSGGASGTRVERVVVYATGTTTAGIVRLFLYDGSAYHLLSEISVTAITPSGTVGSFNAVVDFSGPNSVLIVPSGWSLRATTHNAESFQVTAFGGDF